MAVATMSPVSIGDDVSVIAVNDPAWIGGTVIGVLEHRRGSLVTVRDEMGWRHSIALDAWFPAEASIRKGQP
jgi:hypothetical protein